jgi:hypothetical protein
MPGCSARSKIRAGRLKPPTGTSPSSSPTCRTSYARRSMRSSGSLKSWVRDCLASSMRYRRAHRRYPFLQTASSLADQRNTRSLQDSKHRGVAVEHSTEFELVINSGRGRQSGRDLRPLGRGKVVSIFRKGVAEEEQCLH